MYHNETLLCGGKLAPPRIVSRDGVHWWLFHFEKVRDKMLYSSSKQDIRQGLGLGFFEGEYYANVKADLSFESLVASRRAVTGDQLLSEAE